MTSPQKELKDGRYALLRKLGEGSQGETYEAIDRGTGPEARKNVPLADQWSRYVREQKSGGEVPQDAKLVAIKCFRIGTAKTWKEVELAEREVRTLASLDHPRLPRYFEHFEEDGALYLVMEKIEGESLAAIRSQQRSMSIAEVTKMLEDIGAVLQFLHARAPAVVHRDIKPGNIIRRPDGSFALVDFGAVRDRLRPQGGSTVVGTFGYMAPEQFQGRTSPASDVYGLAATAMTMLTGVEPEELPHVGLGIDVAKALPAGTAAPLVRALTAMLVPDPDQRVGSAADALALLSPIQAKTPETNAASPPPPLRDVRELGEPIASSRWASGRGTRARSAMFAVIAAWVGVWYVMRHDHGHHGWLMAVLLTIAIGLTAYIRRARHAAWAAQRERPKLRVATQDARVRVQAPNESGSQSSDDEGDEPLDESEPRVQRREAPRNRS